MLSAVAYHMPSDSPSPYYMPKHCLHIARDEIVESRLRIAELEKQAEAAARILETMKTRSEKLQKERDDALAMLHGKPETVAIIPAGSQQRGVEGELPEA